MRQPPVEALRRGLSSRKISSRSARPVKKSAKRSERGHAGEGGEGAGERVILEAEVLEGGEGGEGARERAGEVGVLAVAGDLHPPASVFPCITSD
jgi:hypothetical protein